MLSFENISTLVLLQAGGPGISNIAHKRAGISSLLIVLGQSFSVMAAM
ncbi:hypothetical protein [Paenibacillus sp. FSL M7-1046]